VGQEVDSAAFSRADRTRYRLKMRRCLDALAQMLDEGNFDREHQLTGLELELSLIDATAQPAMRNAQVLADLADPSVQTELGKFNLEINTPPRPISGDGLAGYETELLAQVDRLTRRAQGYGARVVMIGVLPTLAQSQAVLENLSPNPRYLQLNEQIMNARGEDVRMRIQGAEQLDVTTDSIAPEAACTSAQFHLQVAPEEYARYWNAAQAVAGAQVALGANSPYLFGRRLWDETRIALFEQATDTRPDELKAQGVRPRVWFGERWITSIFDLFEENLKYFPALLPIVDDEDPMAVLASGGVPSLAELRLHNGTVYRWNRPVYDVTGGRPHLRVENRVLSAGPTVVDILANAAFYFGVVRTLATAERPVWSRLPFSLAEHNFRAACRYGLAATQYWPRHGELGSAELVSRHLAGLADAGLADFGVDAAIRDRLLGVILGRCATGQTGASWQTATVQRLESDGVDRLDALAGMLDRYTELQASNEPVHTWPVG
jgi:gamma-glutamyl:cysteine ligase YbdK (ATP-grasp superfamily)